MKRYCCGDAVCDVLKEMEPGKTILGYEMYGRVLEQLRKHGSKAHPLGESVARRYRERKGRYGIHSTSGVSEYTKIEESGGK